MPKFYDSAAARVYIRERVLNYENPTPNLSEFAERYREKDISRNTFEVWVANPAVSLLHPIEGASSGKRVFEEEELIRFVDYINANGLRKGRRKGSEQLAFRRRKAIRQKG